MCGIYAYLGKKNLTLKQCYEALILLRSRGYDSFGFAWISDDLKVECVKSIEKVLKKTFKKDLLEKESYNLVAHTRWATNGEVAIRNTHPFESSNKKFYLIHNGIINNAEEIKNELKNKKTFSSDTDSEVIVNLLEYYYEKYPELDFNLVLQMTFKRLSGYWSVVILKADEDNTLYVSRNQTPMMIGFSKDELHISSDYNTFSSYVKEYFELENNHILKLEYNKEQKRIVKNFLNYNIREILDYDVVEKSCKPYKYWLEKEIFEQPNDINNLFVRNNIYLNDNILYYPDFDNQYKNLNFQFSNIVLLGSGTSYHATMLGELFFKKLTDINVRSYNVSDFLYNDIPKEPTLFIVVSQSGETKDIYDMILQIKNKSTKNYKFISITNSINSLIPRNCDMNLYLKLSKEISVASTKTFTCSSLLLYIVALKLVNSNNTDFLFNFMNDFNLFFKQSKFKIVKEIANEIKEKNVIFLASSSKNLPIAREANLKIQEICYKFSISSTAKNLKHGPLALIDDNAYVFHFISDKEDYEKSFSVANEIKSRKGHNYLFTTYKYNYSDTYEKVIYLETRSKFLSNLLMILPAQLLTLYLGDLLGHNVDLPKNLAKTVTV